VVVGVQTPDLAYIMYCPTNWPTELSLRGLKIDLLITMKSFLKQYFWNAEIKTIGNKWKFYHSLINHVCWLVLWVFFCTDFPFLVLHKVCRIGSSSEDVFFLTLFFGMDFPFLFVLKVCKRIGSSSDDVIYICSLCFWCFVLCLRLNNGMSSLSYSALSISNISVSSSSKFSVRSSSEDGITFCFWRFVMTFTWLIGSLLFFFSEASAANLPPFE